MSGEPIPVWKKIATFDSSKYLSGDNIVSNNIVTTDKGDKLFVGLGTQSNGVLLQSNDLSNTSPIPWTLSLSFNSGVPFGQDSTIAIDKSGSNIYIASNEYLFRYNNNKSWQKSTDFKETNAVATSSNGKIVYATGGSSLYSNTNSGTGHWTKAKLPSLLIDNIVMSDKGDNIYITEENGYIWRNNNNGWTKALKAHSSAIFNSIATNGSGTKVYASSTDNILYYNHNSGKGSWEKSTSDIKNIKKLTTTSNGKSVYATSSRTNNYIWENHKSGKGDWVKSSFSSGGDYWRSITTNGSGSNVYASLLKNSGKSVEIYKRITHVTTIESLKISSTGIEIGYSNKNPIVDGNIHTAVETYLLNKGKGIKSYGRIEAWDTSNVTDMNGLFYARKQEGNPLYKAKQNFNDNIGNWNTSSVTGMIGMFNDAKSFNQPIGKWNTSSVAYMESVFIHAKSFNQPLNSWNTSGVTYMGGIFTDATLFNQPLKSWNTSGVITMDSMFRDTPFNQNIGKWNTNKVELMGAMFYNATRFNQDLSNWHPAITDKSGVDRFPCGSPLQHKSDFWPKSQTTNFFTKAYFKCSQE